MRHQSFPYSKQPKHNGLGNQDFKYDGFLLIVMPHDSCLNSNSYKLKLLITKCNGHIICTYMYMTDML